MTGQTERVYLAEEEAYEYLDLERLREAGLDEFAREALRRAGWGGPDALPEFVLDIAGGEDLLGQCVAQTGTIRLHRQLLRPEVVLHELAHWLRPMDSHESQWAGTYLGLVEAACGPSVRVELELAFADHGVVWDASWGVLADCLRTGGVV